jgi:hypothetical protein
MNYHFFAYPQVYRLAAELLSANKISLVNLISVRDKADFLKKVEELGPFAGRTYNAADHVTNLHRHMTEQAFLSLLDHSILDLEKKDFHYLQVKRFDKKRLRATKSYLAINATAQYSVRRMPVALINFAAEQARANGVKPLWVGRGSPIPGIVKRKYDKCLVDKTSDPVELLTLFRSPEVKGLLTPDGGISHIGASVARFPVFCYYTTVHPRHRAPLGNGYFTAEMSEAPCAGCQTNYKFVYDCDYRTCIERPEETAAPLCGSYVGGRAAISLDKWLKRVLR